jgi:hypothetical protein
MSRKKNPLPVTPAELALPYDRPLALAETFINLHMRLEDESIGSIGYINIIWSLMKDPVGVQYVHAGVITLASTLDLLDSLITSDAQNLDVIFPVISAEDSDGFAYYTAITRDLVHRHSDIPYSTDPMLMTKNILSCPIQELQLITAALIVRRQSLPLARPWYFDIARAMFQAAVHFCPRWLRSFVRFALKVEVNPWYSRAIRTTVWTMASVIQFWTEVYVVSAAMDVHSVPWPSETLWTLLENNDIIITCALDYALPDSYPVSDPSESLKPPPNRGLSVHLGPWRCSWVGWVRRYLLPLAYITENFKFLIAVWFVLEQYWLIPDLLDSWWFSRGTRLFLAGGTWGFSFVVLSIRSSVQHGFPVLLSMIYRTQKLMCNLPRRTADFQTWPYFQLYRRYHRYLNHSSRRGKMELCACIIGSVCIYVSFLICSLYEDALPGVERTLGYAFYATCTCLMVTFCALAAFLSPT